MTTYNLKDQTGATWVRCTEREAAVWIRRLTAKHPTLIFTLSIKAHSRAEL